MCQRIAAGLQFLQEIRYFIIAHVLFDLLFSSVNCVSLQDGRTALYSAATNGHGIIAGYLISECGANVNDEYYVNRRLLYDNSHYNFLLAGKNRSNGSV